MKNQLKDRVISAIPEVSYPFDMLRYSARNLKLTCTRKNYF